MNHVQRAIIMVTEEVGCVPIALTTPKPQVSINGVRKIDSAIQTLHPLMQTAEIWKNNTLAELIEAESPYRLLYVIRNEVA